MDPLLDDDIAPPGSDRRPRRTQAERRREMRERMVEATLDSLAANGYHGASLGDILGRAGVSRGAWAHHFANKKELVALAAEEMLSRATARADEMADAVAGSDDRLAALLESVWTHFYRGRHRDVLFEVGIACRTDDELRARLAPVFMNFMGAMGTAWKVHFRPRPGAGQDLADVLTLTAYMMRGMALQEIVAGDDPVRNADLRRLWAVMFGRLVEVLPDGA